MFKTEVATSKKQILFANDPILSVGAVIDDAAFVTENGRKKVLAGTPVAGDLLVRTTAFTVAADTPAVVGDLVVPVGGATVVLPEAAKSDAVGILLHDVDVTDGVANGTVVIAGAINTAKIDAGTLALITDATKAALKHIVFVA